MVSKRKTANAVWNSSNVNNMFSYLAWWMGDDEAKKEKNRVKNLKLNLADTVREAQATAPKKSCVAPLDLPTSPLYWSALRRCLCFFVVDGIRTHVGEDNSNVEMAN